MCLLATNFCREKIKLLTLLPFLSLYREGTVLFLTFPQAWLKVMPQIFLEKMKKKRKGGQMLKMGAFEMTPKGGRVSCPITLYAMARLLSQSPRVVAMHQHGAESSPLMGVRLIGTESECPAAGGLRYCRARGGVWSLALACQHCTHGAVWHPPALTRGAAFHT